MREQGVVIRRVSPVQVEVAFPATEACEGCSACHRDSRGKPSIVAAAAGEIKVGDCVEVAIDTGAVMTARFFVYLLPILALLAGYMAGSQLADVFLLSGETAGIAGAFITLVLSVFGIRFYDSHISNRGRYQARVTRIIDSGESTHNPIPR
jgi:positive regulator of sigma E activity